MQPCSFIIIWYPVQSLLFFVLIPDYVYNLLVCLYVKIYVMLNVYIWKKYIYIKLLMLMFTQFTVLHALCVQISKAPLDNVIIIIYDCPYSIE